MHLLQNFFLNKIIQEERERDQLIVIKGDSFDEWQVLLDKKKLGVHFELRLLQNFFLNKIK